jgi:hypothetical protein
MWNLKPSLTPQDIKRKIEHAYSKSATEGLLDAYMAVLSLDSWESMPVRFAILDVAGNTASAGSNGKFDEHDLELFLEYFQFYEVLRDLGGTDPDYSRYDLNGDGFTGGDMTTKFDLNADPLPSFDSFSIYVETEYVKFDENTLTDCDILLFYAYSSLYTGDPGRREELMRGCRGIEIDLSKITRASVGLGVKVTYVKDDQSTHTVDFIPANGVGHGGITDGSMDFEINQRNVYDYSVKNWIGSISGTIDPSGNEITSLNVNVTQIDSLGTMWTQTTSATFSLKNLLLTKVTADYLEYKVTGPALCSHITYLDMSAQWRTGSWALQSYDCIESSEIIISLGPEIPAP